MTPIPKAREDITTSTLAAIAANQEQARHLYDPSREVDSALEHVLAAAKQLTADPDSALHHLRAAAADLTQAHKLNRVEREHEEDVRSLAAEAGKNRWTVQSLAAALRDPLGVLANPMIHGQRRDAATEEATQIIRSAPRGLLVVGDNVKPSLVHELRTSKATALWALIVETGVAA